MKEVNNMSGGSLVVFAVLLSTLSEWLVERFFAPFEILKRSLVFIGAAVGVGLCFGFNVDILSLVGFEGSYPLWLGKVFSGVIIGSGSNVMHDLFKKLQRK